MKKNDIQINDRLLNEVNSYKFLRSKKIESVPNVILTEENLNFVLFEWISGTHIKKIQKIDIGCSWVGLPWVRHRWIRDAWYARYNLAHYRSDSVC